MAAAEAIAGALAAAFPVHAAQLVVVPFSATHRIGIEEVETLLGEWLAPFALDDRRKASAQRKGPAIKGSAAGPETPVAGIIHREGTRSGRKAGDVAVRFDRPLTPVRVPRRNQT